LFAPTAASTWLKDDQYAELDTKVITETMAYTIAFVVDRLAEEIEEAHDWEEKGGFDLHITYQVDLGFAFEEVLGVAKGLDLVNYYWSPDYDDDYDQFWGTPETEITDEDMNKTLGKFMRDSMNEISEEDYNYHRYFVYRMSKIVKVVDREKLLNNVKTTYSGIGLSYYDDAFFGLSARRIKSELKKAYRQ